MQTPVQQFVRANIQAWEIEQQWKRSFNLHYVNSVKTSNWSKAFCVHVGLWKSY